MRTHDRALKIIKSNKTFGFWTVLTYGTKQDYLICQCKCGTLREVNVYSLTSGKSRSCGCMLKTKKLLKVSGPL